MAAISIKGIIFDYGGTIDTNGIHWGEVIKEQYLIAGVSISTLLFREAYVHAERTLAKEPIITPTNTFFVLLTKKIALQAEYLRKLTPAITVTKTQEAAIVKGCYNKVLATLGTTCHIVEKMAQRYPLALVTNFYGNMHVVLKEFSLDRYFPHIIESSVVKIRKPDPALFALGAEALGLHPEEIAVVGDSYRKDIYPASTLGCKTVWLKNICWEEEAVVQGHEPTAIIKSLEELPALLSDSI